MKKKEEKRDSREAIDNKTKSRREEQKNKKTRLRHTMGKESFDGKEIFHKCEYIVIVICIQYS